MGQTWAVILAGGDGMRLHAASIARYGYARPKQFCDFDGEGTLLARTIRRALRVVPEHRVVVIATEPWEREAQQSLAEFGRAALVMQPRNLDTTPGLLLPLLRILGVDPEAQLLVLPSDHHVADETQATKALLGALASVAAAPEHVTLLGAVPTASEEGYGWVVPGPSRGGVHQVSSFREKPPVEEATALFDGGALLNTFMLAGQALTFAELFATWAPGWWRAMVEARGGEARGSAARLTALYEVLPASNFSSAVLARAIDRLLVLAAPGLGWTDVGTPERLSRALGPLSAQLGPGLADWRTASGRFVPARH